MGEYDKGYYGNLSKSSYLIIHCMNQRSQKDKFESTSKSVIWIILTNSYFNQHPKPINQEKGGNGITEKCIEQELLRVVIERTARERREENQPEEIVSQFQSLIISDDSLDTNWISSNSHESHIKYLKDTEIQIIIEFRHWT